jgi:hypothetical protein
MQSAGLFQGLAPKRDTLKDLGPVPQVRQD